MKRTLLMCLMLVVMATSVAWGQEPAPKFYLYVCIQAQVPEAQETPMHQAWGRMLAAFEAKGCPIRETSWTNWSDASRSLTPKNRQRNQERGIIGQTIGTAWSRQAVPASLIPTLIAEVAKPLSDPSMSDPKAAARIVVSIETAISERGAIVNIRPPSK